MVTVNGALMLSVPLPLPLPPAERCRKIQEDISCGCRRALVLFSIPKDTGRILPRPPARVDVILCSKNFQKIQEEYCRGHLRASMLSSVPKISKRYRKNIAAATCARRSDSPFLSVAWRELMSFFLKVTARPGPRPAPLNRNNPRDGGKMYHEKRKTRRGYCAREEMLIHHMMHRVLQKCRAKILFTPRILSFNRYIMDHIDVSWPVYEPRGLTAIELDLIWNEAAAVGIFAWDFELYLQVDGRVAMIDFDKFGVRRGDTWVFPVDLRQWMPRDLLCGVFMPRKNLARFCFLQLSIQCQRKVKKRHESLICLMTRILC